MKSILRILLLLFTGCFGLGFIVSKLEKKKGWVEGHKPYGIYEKHVKRPLDFALALFALILFWPVLLIIAIAVRINMGSPVVFEQERLGLGGEVFKIRKFRTMTKCLVIIGQTEESTVNMGFRKASSNHSNWGRDLYSGIVWNKTVYGEMKLIA